MNFAFNIFLKLLTLGNVKFVQPMSFINFIVVYHTYIAATFQLPA